ncbi:MAG: hypothetical protein IPK26_24730 [Planctomycetes bacterium]|nr:hypothetical protein [Planctomycetota bacterium]
MTHLHCCGFSLTFLAAAVAQAPSPQAWLQARYGQQLPRMLASQVLADAQAAGLVATPAARVAMKQAFYALTGKLGRVPPYRRTDAGIRQVVATTPGGIEMAMEHEFNDSWRWADALGANTVATGDNATPNDLDTWTYVADGLQLVTFAVTGTGPSPIVDSTITIKDSQGDPVAFADTAGNQSLSLYLPAGTFHVEVGAWMNTFTTPATYEGGGYDLTITTAALNTGTPRLLVAAANGTTQVPAGAGHDVFRIALTSDSRVALSASSTGDTVLWLQRSNGALVFANDDSTIGGLSAAADVDLLAGTYYAYVTDFGGTAGLAFTLTKAVTPLLPMRDVATSPLVTDTLAGPESMRLYRLNLGFNQGVTLVTGANGAGAGDTVLSIMDRRYGLAVENDDALSGYARLSGSLPLGNWLVAVTPFPGAAGGYSLTTTVGSPYVSTPLTFGTNGVAIPATPGAFASYHVSNCTETSTRLRVPTPNGSEYTLLDQNGVGDSLPGSDWYAQAVELAAGTSQVLVFSRLAVPFAFALDVLPTLAIEASRVRTRSKEGDAAILLASLSPLTPGVNLGLGDRGLLCLPLGTIATVGLQIVGPSGIIDWAGAPPVPFNINLQQGDLHTGATWTPGFFGSWRNVHRL